MAEAQPAATTEPTDGRDSAPEDASPLRSVHTDSFARILDKHGLSIAVTTYQAGKLVLLRPDRTAQAPVVNTHFRNFRKPMGFAWEYGRFALGTTSEIWEFHDVPAVAPKLDSAESAMPFDAAFLPRTCHVTGDVQIHEMVWVPMPKPNPKSVQRNFSELCFVSTRFSCLATLSNPYSFVPRWRPSFITALTPEDRCHLNGVGLRDGRVRYASALAETNTAGGWRDRKRDGGILMDVTSNQIIARGLSMPHSPRWRRGKLWLLESGKGSVGVVDEQTGRYQEVCRLPGFTRGLDFAGRYAFVGLSQVRESAVFSGIAIAEQPAEERCCGVWAIDTETGQVAGFVKFTDAVQEVFAVQVLPGLRWPEVLNEDQKRIAETYQLPDDALRDVPNEIMRPVEKQPADGNVATQ
jgi:uncharacterized protein (TIGR03032 family)